jgi:hypothetical protein
MWHIRERPDIGKIHSKQDRVVGTNISSHLKLLVGRLAWFGVPCNVQDVSIVNINFTGSTWAVVALETGELRCLWTLSCTERKQLEDMKQETVFFLEVAANCIEIPSFAGHEPINRVQTCS